VDATWRGGGSKGKEWESEGKWVGEERGGEKNGEARVSRRGAKGRG
jgi:hypothetical protein